MAAGALRVVWLHGDHLGSASLTTYVGFPYTIKTAGEMRYLPFGETHWASGDLQTDRRFTGQRWEAGLGGLYDYGDGTRFYSPGLGRFISPDSLVPDPLDPQSYNRYSYALNAPEVHNDPTGHFAHIVVGATFGALIGGGVNAVTQLLATGDIDTREVIASTVGGAIQGGICAASAGIGCIVGGAAAGAAAQSIVSDILYGDTVSLGQAVESAAVNTAASVLTLGVSDRIPALRNGMGRLGLGAGMGGATQMVSNLAQGKPLGDNVGTAMLNGFVAAAADRLSYPLMNSGRGPYGHLRDPRGVVPGRDFTPGQKASIYRENMRRNLGVIRSDYDGQLLYRWKETGGAWRPDHANVDHHVPKAAGGTNSYRNARVLSALHNQVLKQDR